MIDTLVALVRLGLISEEQAETEYQHYLAEHKQWRADAEWWAALANIAEKQYGGRWTRTLGNSFRWKLNWINAHKTTQL